MDEIVLVKNSGQGLILVGDRYMHPGERRMVPRSLFEAAAAKNKNLVVGETISQEIIPPEPPAETPIELPPLLVESPPVTLPVFEPPRAQPMAWEDAPRLDTPVKAKSKKKLSREK